MKDCPEITRLRNLAKLIGGNQIGLIEEYKKNWIETNFKLQKAIEALNKIANTDFRGPRPSESIIAYNALKELGLR